MSPQPKPAPAAPPSADDVQKRIDEAVKAAVEEERASAEKAREEAVAKAVDEAVKAARDAGQDTAGAGQELVKRVVSGQFVAYKRRVRTVQGAEIVTYATGYRGDEVDLFPEDVERLEGLGMLAPEGGHAATLPADVDRLTDDELVTFIRESRPNVDELLSLTGDDPARAQKLLAAEQRQEKPRKGVVENLEAFIRHQPAE